MKITGEELCQLNRVVHVLPRLLIRCQFFANQAAEGEHQLAFQGVEHLDPLLPATNQICARQHFQMLGNTGLRHVGCLRQFPDSFFVAFQLLKQSEPARIRQNLEDLDDVLKRGTAKFVGLF